MIPASLTFFCFLMFRLVNLWKQIICPLSLSWSCRKGITPGYSQKFMEGTIQTRAET